jgi:hypothetical protein
MVNFIKRSKDSYIALMKERIKKVNTIAGNDLIADTGNVNEIALKEVNKKIVDKKITGNDLNQLSVLFSNIKTMKDHIDNNEFIVNDLKTLS